LPCSEGFYLGSPVYRSPQKPTSPTSNSTRIKDLHENQLRLIWLFRPYRPTYTFEDLLKDLCSDTSRMERYNFEQIFTSSFLVKILKKLMRIC